MLKVSHHLYQSASALLVFSIPAAVFWPYFAGAVTLVIGPGTSIKNRIGRLPDSTNSSFWSALVCDCHGGLRRRPLRHGQLRCEDCTVVDFGARILGLAHRGNLPRPAEPQYARFAATLLGITVLALVLFAYLPLTITQASDVANGLNYLAIHLAPAGAAFFLAGALPAAISELPPFLKSSDPVFASRQVLKRLARYHRA